MKHLSEQKLQEICESYINGNKGWVADEVLELNQLQVIELIVRAKEYGVDTEKLVRTLRIFLED